jgi:anti-sigma B factor antagonist
LPEAPQSEDKVLVTLFRGVALVRVQGRGSFKISTALKQFGEAALAGGCSTAVVDLGACSGMDSTFMGVLAGIATRLKRQGSGDLYLLKLSPRTRHLVTTLGLSQIVCICEPGEEPEPLRKVLAETGELTSLQIAGSNTRETAQTMLEAHENLTDLLPDNRPRFKDVLTFLREDLQRKTEPPPG